MAALSDVAASLNEKFAQLNQTWLEALVVNDRVRIGMTEAGRKATTDKSRVAPGPESLDGVQQLTSLINETLASSASVWATCGVDSELYFLTRGECQLRTPGGAAASDKPLLRYWDARGRCQAIRLMLSDALGTDGWERDVLTPSQADDWRTTLKADASYSGPWHTLPAVRARSGGPLVCQTEACARYLAAHLGLAGRDLDEQAAADALTCATYQAVTTVTAKALYAPDEDSFQKELAQIRTSYPAYLANLVEILGQKDYFVDAHRPLYCDYFVLDALQQADLVLDAAVVQGFPTLVAFKARMEQRPNVSAEIARTYTKWCYSPTEQANLDRLAAIRQN